MTIKLFHRRARGGAPSSAAGATARVLAAGMVGMSSGGAGPATSSHAGQRPHVEHLEGRQLLAVDLTVNTMQRFHPIDGFGSSIASYNGSVYTSAWADMFYQDLGASILRMDLNVNALRGPDNDIGTPVTMGEDINANVAQFNFSQQRVKPYGDMAAAAASRKIDDFKVIASIWSPPHWMKGPEVDPWTGQPNGAQPTVTNTGNDASGGSLIDTPENLQQFGRYVAAYVKGFQQTFGVPIYAISIQNELAFHESYSSCVYTGAMYVKALKAVHDAFAHYGIDTKIEGPEDVGVGRTGNVGILQRQMMYVDAVRHDAEAMKDVDIYSIHGFASEPETQGRSPEMWREYWNGRPAGTYAAPNWTGIKDDGKRSWMTETSGEAHTIDGGLELAGKALDALVQANASAYVYWQTSMYATTYDNQALTAGTDKTDKKYNVAKQFFRYIRPGSYRVAASPSDPTGLYVASFTHEQQHTITTVLVNLSASSRDVSLTVNGGSGLTGYQIARRTSATENFADVGPVNLTDGAAHFTIPARSVLTLQGAFTPPDLTPPTVEKSSFDYDAQQRLRMQFSEAVTGVRASDLVVENLSDGSVVASAADATMDSDNAAFFTFSPAVLPDGNYRASLPAGTVTDTSGNGLSPGGRGEFFVLGGDANRDRVVNLVDFTYLASDFNLAGQTFSQGNFDYAGRVDLSDFAILAHNFNWTLDPPAAMTSAAKAARRAKRAQRAVRLSVTKSDRVELFSGQSLRETVASDVLEDDGALDRL